MARNAQCPRCGRPLPTDALEDLCPACLLDAALNLTSPPRGPATLTRRTLNRKRLLHYHLLEKIGEGGMGVVYKARDTRLDRIVAIKVLPAEHVDDPERRRRFIAEAKAASALNHPNIVTIHEVAASAGVHFIVMEFVEGRTLDKLVGPHGLPPEQVLLYAIPIAGALVRAHEAGIIHRDLKPQNIMVRDDGLVKLLDFGLAKLAETTVDDAEPTGHGESGALLAEATRIMGTPGFMAPEQIRGGKVDARTDIFAFGAVLYHALCGKKPFARSTADETLAAILHEEPATLERVPAPLAAIVPRCLRKRADDRFPSAAELQAALRAASSDAGAARPEPSIAVMPFAVLGGHPQDDYFGEALSGEIITALARIPGLKVTGRTSSRGVHAKHLDPRAIGQRLGVAHLLEGSIHRTESVMRVSVRLLGARDGRCLWAERFERTPADVFAIQDEIAQAVSRLLDVAGRAPGPLVSPPTENLEAYHRYLMGRHAYASVDLRGALEHFGAAVQLDPSFALGFDALAETWWQLGFFAAVDPREAISRGVWAAIRALELNDRLADTHALLAMYRVTTDCNWSEVHRSLHRAKELDPTSLKVRLRNALTGELLQGHLAKAAEEFESLLRTDPLDHFARVWLAHTRQYQRDYVASIEQCREIIATDPRYPLSHAELGMSLGLAGRPAEAIAALRDFAFLTKDSPYSVGLLAWGYARAGEHGQAQELIDQLRNTAARIFTPPSALAVGFVGLGDIDTAMTYLERGIDVRDFWALSLRLWPVLDPVRSHPRYPELLRRTNQEP